MSDFDKLIEDLALLWLAWLETDRILRNTDLGVKVRRAAGEKGEALIKKRYQIIENINKYFDKEG